MGYLVQKTRVSSLTVGGVDYTSSLISWEVSDQSAQNNGFMTTAGTLVLGQRPGQTDLEDYDRNVFKRGAEVILDITDPGGSSYRHPRGLLYVVTVSYSVEAEQLEIAIGCKLTLLQLIDDHETLLPLAPIPLDPAQENLQSINGSFSSAGKILYQDNQGALTSRKFFDSDGFSGIEAGSWVSVLGETALQVEPLGASDAIPDQIDLTYQVPIGALAVDGTGRIDTVEEISNYFINYPVTVFERTPPPPDPDLAGDPPESNAPPSEVEEYLQKQSEQARKYLADKGVTAMLSGTVASGCGTGRRPNTISFSNNPDRTPDIACNGDWSTNRVDQYLPAIRTATSETHYGAPGAQVSYIKQTVYGPAVEANSQYYADKYAFCVADFGYGCNPSGNCPFEGMGRVLLSYSETFNEYDEDSNVLVRTTRDTYANKISAANTVDYRSGVNNGVPQDFDNNLSTSAMFRASRVVTDYYKEGNSNVELTTTYSSVASRGVGISTSGSLDALDGIRTTVRRESTTTTTLDLRPDTVNSPATATEEALEVILLNTNSFQAPPSEAGPYVVRQTIPVPLLSEDAAEIAGWVADYSYYLRGFTRGDLFGLRIGEALRTEIASSWYPGMPFRYVDTSNGKILAMRMDACSWGVTQDEAIVVTNGVWTGYSSGTLSMGSNLVGNSTPVLDTVPGTATPLTTPASGANAIYANVAVDSTSGSGTGMLVNIEVVNGGASTSDWIVTVVNPGEGYEVGDTITINNSTLQTLDPTVGTGDLTTTLTTGSVTPPPGPDAPPVIDDDIVGDSYSFSIDVHLALDTSMFSYFENPVVAPNPTDLTAKKEMTFIVFVAGAVVSAGDILETEGDGSIPVELSGALLVQDANVIDGDVFDPSNVDVSTPPIVTGDTQALLHFNGSLSDASGLSRTFTAENGATTSAVQAKFGTHSLLVSESGSVSTPANTDTGFDLGTKDFTIEMFLYPTAALSSSFNYEEILDCSGTGADWWDEAGWQLVTRRSTYTTLIEFSWYDVSDDQRRTFGATISDSASLMKPNEWNHLVVQRSYSSGRLAFWLNGRQVYDVVSTGAQEDIRSVSDKTNPILRIGANADETVGSYTGYEGYIDDVRIVTDGIRYDFGAGVITVPTSPLT